MENKSVQERVIDVLTKRAKRQPGEINPNLLLSDQILDTDWRNHIERAIILVDLEDEFGYEIDDGTADKWRTVADIISHFEILLSPKERLL